MFEYALHPTFYISCVCLLNATLYCVGIISLVFYFVFLLSYIISFTISIVFTLLMHFFIKHPLVKNIDITFLSVYTPHTNMQL